MIRLLIVDDHPLVRAGLRAITAHDQDVRVVGEAADGRSAIDLVGRLAPDVVLMDLSMPGIDGVEAIRQLTCTNPAAVVVLTSYPDHDRVTAALDAGAVGYLLKDSDRQTLLRAIHDAAAGHAPIDPRVTRALLPGGASRACVETAPDRPEEPPLSAREQEVLGLVAKGMANKQIARSLGISEGTVKAHVGNIFRAIGVSERTSAALWARNRGLA